MRKDFLHLNSIFVAGMHDRKHTNRTKLMQGLKTLAASLPLSFAGPTILFSTFKNQDHFLFIPVLILALALMGTAVFLLFRGIGTIMKSLFD